MAAKNTVIAVLGMHRSGTSAFARAISLLGASLPKTLIPAAPDNPLGFWESGAIARLNNKLLDILEMHWQDLRTPADDVFQLPQLVSLRTAAHRLIKSEFGSAPLIMLKDPRMCRLFPFWRDVFAELNMTVKVIMPIRNPLEVADSLLKRDKTPLDQGMLLWLRHVIDAERYSREYSRSIVSYEDLLKNPSRVLNQITSSLEQEWPKSIEDALPEVDSFISSTGRHHRHETTDLKDHPDCVDWILQAYQALQKVASGNHQVALVERMDRIFRDFQIVEKNLDGPATGDVSAALPPEPPYEVQEVHLPEQHGLPQRDEAYATIKQSELFDEPYYRSQIPEISSKTDLVRHFVDTGALAGLDPHRWFKTSFYLQNNPDVAAAGVNPLFHYLRHGAEEHRDPHPNFSSFYYFLQYHDELSSGSNALLHFIKNGEPATESRPAARRDEPLDELSVCIGVVTFNNTPEDLARLVRSIQTTTSSLRKSTVLLIDNGAPSDIALPDAGFQQIDNATNLGYTKAMNILMNRAFSEHDADLFVTANPDGAFHHAAIGRMISHHIEFPNALIEARQFPEEHPKVYNPVSDDTPWASGCCLMVPREVREKIGDFDENFFQFVEDVDYSWRARLAGLQVKICPSALFFHQVIGVKKDETAARYYLESGRYLAHKWGNHAFRSWCENALVENEFYPTQESLPKLDAPQKEYKKKQVATVVQFEKAFSFCETRW